jgi:hypothetical protein
MPQKPDLAAALAGAGGSTRRAPVPAPPPAASAHEHRSKAASTRPSTTVSQPGRAGTKPITAHLPAQVRGQLKLLAAERGRTLQDLMSEAFNDLFAKYGKPEIAPQKGL